MSLSSPFPHSSVLSPSRPFSFSPLLPFPPPSSSLLPLPLSSSSPLSSSFVFLFLPHMLTAGSLRVLRQHHIIHRDIKPQNLLLSYPQGKREQMKFRDTTIKLGEGVRVCVCVESGRQILPSSYRFSFLLQLTLVLLATSLAQTWQPPFVDRPSTW